VLPGLRIANNIVGRRQTPHGTGTTSPGRCVLPWLTSDYNLFADPSGVVIIDNDVSFSGLAAYRRAHPEAESHSLEGMPAFHSEADGDFRLAPGSVGIQVAPDALDFDADGDLSRWSTSGPTPSGRRRRHRLGDLRRSQATSGADGRESRPLVFRIRSHANMLVMYTLSWEGAWPTTLDHCVGTRRAGGTGEAPALAVRPRGLARRACVCC